jgi:hypothetical protein
LTASLAAYNNLLRSRLQNINGSICPTAHFCVGATLEVYFTSSVKGVLCTQTFSATLNDIIYGDGNKKVNTVVAEPIGKNATGKAKLKIIKNTKERKFLCL